MTSTLTCPDETELLALAVGEPVAPAVTAHVDGCASCQARLDRLGAEVALLRANRPEAPRPPSPSTSPSTVDDPTTRPSGAPGSDDHGGATTSWHSHDEEGDLDSSSRTDAGDDGETSVSPEAPLPGAIGRFLVIGRFPHSGQADVFRVVHPQFQQERVLKLAKEPVALDGRCDIVEEGKILADLDHPHLVRVYDIDFLGDRPYLVMEYVRGRNLEQYAAEGPIAPRQAAALVAKVAGAAAYAHGRGIVHRDIKHKNILIDEAGEPRLIDFGIARLRTAWSDDTKEHDGGTFAFMAPEQARIEQPEERKKVGPRSDVFALGGVLYFLLTGSAPFSGRSWNEAWDRARRCEFDAKALNEPKIPAGLRRICLKAMAAEPGERYASAEALQKALNRYVARPRIQAAIAGVLGVVVLAGGLYALSKRLETQPSPRDSSLASMRGPLPSPIPAPLAPIKGRINLLVVKSQDGTRRRLRLQDPGAVPVRARDEVRIEARLDRPAYLYLFWISSDGTVAPLYPWKEHDWSKRPLDERKVKDAELPEIFDDVLEMPVSPPGMETLVLLAREQTPLPRGDEKKLAQLLAGAAISSALDLDKPVWIEDGEEVAFERSVAAADGDNLLSRGIPSPKTRKSDDPVLRIRALLSEKVKPLGSYSQAVLFPNQGGS
jgi:serine/threonine protein kinase